MGRQVGAWVVEGGGGRRGCEGRGLQQTWANCRMKNLLIRVRREGGQRPRDLAAITNPTSDHFHSEELGVFRECVRERFRSTSRVGMSR